MANIRWIEPDNPKRKRAQITWECRSVSGKRKRMSRTMPVGTKMKEIQEFKRKVEIEFENGQTIDFQKRTLEEFVEEYLERKKDFLSPSTFVSYKQAIYAKEKGIITHLGKIELQKLTTAHVQDYVNYMMRKGLSAKTIKNSVTILSSIYNNAMKLSYVTTGVNITKNVELPRIQKVQIESYTEEELKTLLSLADELTDEMLKLAVYILVGTGMRRSEIMGITVDSIDFEKKMLNVYQSKVISVNGEEIKGTKTKCSTRQIPINAELLKLLKRAVVRYNQNKMRRGRDFNDSRLIFSEVDGTPMKNHTLSNRYRRWLKKYSDKIRYLPMHAAGRHSFASVLISSGADIKTVQTLMGHSSAMTTMDIYASAYDTKKKECIDRMNEMIFARNA